MKIHPVRRLVWDLQREWQLPDAARRERRRDRLGLPKNDPGADAVIDAGIAWLGRAQDASASADGGVARHYSLVNGWATSYPETTGYIVPTLLDYAEARGDDDVRRRAGDDDVRRRAGDDDVRRRAGDDDVRQRARRMLDWLVAIQLDGGGFQGGRIDAEPVVPVTFNTGQILIGLAAGVRAFGAYRDAMVRAADWLVASQDADGCWRAHPTPLAERGEKAYETHVAWGLFAAHEEDATRGYLDAAARQVRWALTKQRDNGWIADCCLSDPVRPLTHTLGYALRGIVEAFRATGDEEFLDAARRTADGLMTALGDDGDLPGKLDAGWNAASKWVCLTGTAQIAHSWLLLSEWTGDARYLDAGRRANRYVRRTVRLDGPPETQGAVKGSFPVHGEYGKYEYLNWAVKFMVDANVCERALTSTRSSEAAG